MNQSNTYYSKNQDLRFTMTTPEEETELWRKAKDEGCEASRTFLIQNHLLFAMMQAERMVGGRLPRNEVTSAANFAVMRAFERFDYHRGFRFTVYLRPFIRGEISALWKSKFSGGSADPSLGAAVYQADYICAGVNNSDEMRMRGDARTKDIGALGMVDHEAEGRDLAKFNGKLLVEAIATLSKKDAALIRMVYIQGMNMADVARRRGVSRAAVQSTHAKIMKKLKRVVTKAGVER